MASGHGRGRGRKGVAILSREVDRAKVGIAWAEGGFKRSGELLKGVAIDLKLHYEQVQQWIDRPSKPGKYLATNKVHFERGQTPTEYATELAKKKKSE